MGVLRRAEPEQEHGGRSEYPHGVKLKLDGQTDRGTQTLAGGRRTGGSGRRGQRGTGARNQAITIKEEGGEM